MASARETRFEAGGAAGVFLQLFPRRERDLAGLSQILVCSGALEARLALTENDVRRAQELRYRVFFEEGGAIPGPAARLIRRDVCRFDEVCDHLVVVDRRTRYRDGAPKVVGTYRLLRQDLAEHNFGFYGSREFDVNSLIARHPAARFLELGRACIASTHRGKRTLELLWRGIWIYARHHRMDALIGCASLPGVDPAAHAPTIRMLARSGGDSCWRVSARAESAGAIEPVEARLAADPCSSVRALPPLVKGYWRLGATFSPGPAVDHAFGTTDLFVVLPLSDVEKRYLRYFGVEAVPVPLTAQ